MNRMPLLAVLTGLSALLAAACPVKPTTAGRPDADWLVDFAVRLDADRTRASFERLRWYPGDPESVSLPVS